MFNPTDIVNVVSQWLEVPFNSLAGALSSVATGFSDFTNSIGSQISGFANNVSSGFNNIISAVNDKVQSVVSAVNSVGDFISSLPDKIVSGISDLLKFLFVPNPDNINQNVKSTLDELNAKLPIVVQITSLFTSLFTSVTPQKPNFTISIPQWGVHNLSVFDADMIDQYMPYIRGLILSLFWIFTIIKVAKMLPNVLGGLTSYNESDWHESYLEHMRDKWS